MRYQEIFTNYAKSEERKSYNMTIGEYILSNNIHRCEDCTTWGDGSEINFDDERSLYFCSECFGKQEPTIENIMVWLNNDKQDGYATFKALNEAFRPELISKIKKMLNNAGCSVSKKAFSI